MGGYNKNEEWQEVDKRQMKLAKEAKEGNKESRDKLILEFVNLVYDIVYNKMFLPIYANTLLSYEDLAQSGMIGLINGIDNYNPEVGVPLYPYLSTCIVNEIRVVLRKYNNKDKLIKTVELNEAICSIDESFEDKVDLSVTLDQAVKYLDDKEFELFMDFFVTGISVAELKKKYNCTRANIYRILHIIRTKLMKRIQ